MPLADLVHERLTATVAKGRDNADANITIIEGNDASQFGIGIVSTWIAEAVPCSTRL